ncbi:MAG: type II secretion system F family protein [Dehalococcoidia bacterium]|nr:type II secretion system F family protein [Dehalococcoidia bacterium]MDD5493149.1 type II secretion system F family protein [Dehalococcoidia bacterium]
MEFEYVGYNQERRIVKGKLTADTEKEAGDQLAESGYQVLTLKANKSLLANSPTIFRKTVKPEEIIMFSRQLALLLESGVGIVQGLELLQKQSDNKDFTRILKSIVADLRAGSPLSASLDKHPEAFNKMFCKIIAVGEQTGQLEGVLRNLADYTEQATAAVRKIKQAMTYPVIVLVLAVVVSIITVTFVMPPIMNLFKSFGGELPIVTRILIGGMEFISTNGLYLLLGILILVLAILIYTGTPNGAYQRDNLFLKLPVLGRLNLLNSLGRVCKSISLLFKSGLPLPDILTLTAESSGNKVIARALMEVEQDIIKGEALAVSMQRKPLFLPLMVEMTRVGEETGNLDNTLTIVADSFEIEAGDKLQTLLGMIEPAMTITIGLVVGFLALSIFIPLYSSMSLIGG